MMDYTKYSEPSNETVEEIKALDECSMEELVEVATKEGITVMNGVTRDELIVAINNKREEVMDELIAEANECEELIEEELKLMTDEPEETWAVTQEDDGVHVRPVVDGEIVETPVVEVIKPEETKKDVLPAVITGCAKLNVRKEASKTADVVCVLANGTEVTIDVAESTEDFYKIYAVSGETLIEGYCIKDFVSINIK